MKYIALSGLSHSLRRYLSPDVLCLNAPSVRRISWSRREAIRVSAMIREPTVLIGFSAGATAALDIAAENPLVKDCYAHSPLMRLESPPRCHVWLFQTKGDRTPAYDGADDVFEYLRGIGHPTFYRRNMPPVDPEPIRGITTWVMSTKGHQFRNCLRFLPPEVVR